MGNEVSEMSGADQKPNIGPDVAPDTVPNVVEQSPHIVADKTAGAQTVSTPAAGLDTAANLAAAKPAAGKQLVKQLIGVVLAAVFLWFAFRGIDLGRVWTAMQAVNLTWIGLLVVSTLVSHWARAIRWVIMLQPLSERKISTWNSFCAVMFGYAVNIPIPRGGEVARIIAISKSENIPWIGVVPTLLIDRLLDFALLVCFVGLTMAVLPPDLKQHAGFLVPAGVMMCVATVVGLALLPKGGAIIRFCVGFPAVAARLPESLKSKAGNFAEQVDQGTRSLSNPGALLMIAFLSFAIWGLYFMNFYCTLNAFGWQSQINMVRSLIIWTISSVSVIIPTPGCAGSFHIAASEALTNIGGIEKTQALAFATLLHAISFVIVPCATAAVCFLVQNAFKRQRSQGA